MVTARQSLRVPQTGDGHLGLKGPVGLSRTTREQNQAYDKTLGEENVYTAGNRYVDIFMA